MLPRVSLIRCDDADYLLFSTRDAVSSTIYFNGDWAKPLLTISRLFYHGIDNPFILDIGANLGAYCIPIAKEIQAQSGSIFAFEPQRIIFYQLCGNVFLNRLDNVFAFCQALGDEEGMITLPAINYGNSANIGGFSLDEKIRAITHPVETIKHGFEPEVPLLRLDNLSVPHSPCLIKIDVEGLELKVLKGGMRFLEKHGYPPILLEAWTNDWFEKDRRELLDFIKQLGYEIFEIMDEVIAQHPGFNRFIKFYTDPDGTIRMEQVR